MWIRTLKLSNIKCFEDTGHILFSKGVNVFTGPNNAGKTTILQCLYSLQTPNTPIENYASGNTRCGRDSFVIDYEFEEVKRDYLQGGAKLPEAPLSQVNLSISGDGKGAFKRKARIHGDDNPRNMTFPNVEPQNWIAPFPTNRKPPSYSEQISGTHAQTVTEANPHLYSKIDRIVSNPDSPECKLYYDFCLATLGFKVLCAQSSGGKKGGLVVNEDAQISLDRMGEGSKNLLSFIVDLCRAKGKLVVMEEPENDLHPSALKILLNLIQERSSLNQFIISTHSNIVVKHLGSHPDAHLFSIARELKDGIPTSSVIPLERSPKARIEVLQSLGYELVDFDMYSAYLILEESSAERIINDILIPYFCPKLIGRLRTVSSRGLGNVSARFEAFYSLFVFLNVTEPYKEKGWVIVDGCPEGLRVINQLKEAFPKWNPERFKNFSERDFERYYPPFFKDNVDGVLQMPHGEDKQRAKKKLMEMVVLRNAEHPETAKLEFETSAKEVILALKDIESVLAKAAS
jgi:predicted ATPase